jgi:DNA-binding LacI/PurR family transcriptional regulator
VTSVDVARRAGVSQSTVSLVLSGKAQGRVSARTEAVVRAAARDLGYRPNVAARALRTGVARTVGLVVPDVTHPFFGPVLRGAQQAAWRAGYAVALVDVPPTGDWALAPVEALQAGPVDGLMCFEVEPPEGTEVPIVAIETETPGVPFVRFDTEAGTAAAFRHLLELGHTRIGHLAAAFEAPTFDLRTEVGRKVMAAAGLDPDEQPRAVTELFEFPAAAAAATELLDAGATAIFADDDVIAGGVYLATRARGLRIPRDVSLVGYDDLPFAQILDPPLTTIAADPAALGAAAFEVLAARMRGENGESGRIIPVELIERGSTGPPPTGTRRARR